MTDSLRTESAAPTSPFVRQPFVSSSGRTCRPILSSSVEGNHEDDGGRSDAEGLARDAVQAARQLLLRRCVNFPWRTGASGAPFELSSCLFGPSLITSLSLNR